MARVFWRHWKSWFAHTTRSSRRNVPRRRTSSLRLRVEPMEERTLLSVTFDWVNVFGTAGNDSATGVALDSSGNVYQCGVENFVWPNGRMFLRKIDAGGSVLWSSPLNANMLNLQDVVVDGLGQVYVTGQAARDPSDIFVAKVDPTDGHTLWTRTMGGYGNDSSQNLAVDGQGNLYVAGAFRYTANFGNGWSLTVGTGADTNGFLVKLNASDGQTQWAYRAGSNATSVAVDSCGDIYVGSSVRYANESYFGASSNATTLTSYSGFDSAVAKYTPAGALSWAKSWAGTGYYDAVRTLATDGNDNLVVALDINGNANLDPNDHSSLPVHANGQVTALCKLDSDGSFLWGGQQNVPNWNDYNVSSFNSLAIDSANQVYLATCARTAVGPEDWDTWIVKFDGADGTPLWTEIIGGTSSDTRPGGLSIDAQGHIFLSGSFTSTADFDPTSGTQFRSSGGANDAYLLKLSQGLAAQTITFDPLRDKTFGDADFAISAAASSGLPVTFSASGDATVLQADGVWMVHLTGVGSATITAHQAGDATYYPAPDVSRAFAIASPPVVNTPPVAVDDAYRVAEDGGLVVAAPGLLGNDGDPDGDPLAASLVSEGGPAHGAVNLSSDGSFAYAPLADFSGVDCFVYQVSDGRGGTCTATVTITVLSASQQLPDLAAEVGLLVGPGNPLNVGEGNSLTTKLDVAGSALDKGNVNAGIQKLGAFVNEVEAKIKSGKLTPDQGQALIDAANAAIVSAQSGVSAKARVFATLGGSGPADSSWLKPLEQPVLDALLAAQLGRV